MNKQSEYDFIIDTDSYSGNFERELCAYITGHWDHNTHGGDQCKVFEDEVGLGYDIFEDYIEERSDDHDGCYIPSYQSIEGGPQSNGLSNSVAIHFSQRPTDNMVNLMIDRSYKFAREGKIFDRPSKLEIQGFRLRETVITRETKVTDLGMNV